MKAKKTMMSSDGYYNRKTEADFIEEELSSFKGCQRAVWYLIWVLLIGGAVYALTVIFKWPPLSY